MHFYDHKKHSWLKTSNKHQLMNIQTQIQFNSMQNIIITPKYPKTEQNQFFLLNWCTHISIQNYFYTPMLECKPRRNVAL